MIAHYLSTTMNFWCQLLVLIHKFKKKKLINKKDLFIGWDQISRFIPFLHTPTIFLLDGQEIKYANIFGNFC